jgi:hypothetical protein
MNAIHITHVNAELTHVIFQGVTVDKDKLAIVQHCSQLGNFLID